MYLADAFAVLLRRWVVVLLGVIVTGSACAAVIKYVEPDYQASGELYLLLPPEATGAKTPTNPFLNFQSGMSTTASLVAGSVSSKDTQRELAARGLDAEYAVALAPESGPLLVFTAKDKDPQVALDTRNAVMLKFAAELERMQVEGRVPEQQLIVTRVNNTSKQAEVLPGSRLRALAGAAGAGMLLTLLLAFGTDRFAGRRAAARARRAEARQEAAEAEADSDADGSDDSDDSDEDRAEAEKAARLAKLARPRLARKRDAAEPPTTLAG